ncbi:MAG TPA: periplasmic heavy metal sensor [Psychromonas hadalis]|nr:periplasmic heavy metal sensor [Psychromonas hadalis]
MKTKLSTIALTVALSLGLASAVSANSHNGQGNGNGRHNNNCEMNQGMHNGHGKHHKMMGGKHGKQNMFSRLDLSDAQKTEIQAIMKNAHPQRGIMNKEMRAKHQSKMQALMAAPEFDEAMARSMIEEHQKMKTERKLGMMKARHDAYQVLTEDQKEALHKMKQEKFVDVY